MTRYAHNRQPIKRPMTALMAMALGDIIDKGCRVVRQQGGYWTEPGAPRSATIGYPFAWYVNTPTIDGLVRRGELEYTEWKDGKNGRFPIAAQVVATEEASHG